MKKNRPVFYDMGFSEEESLAFTFKARLYMKLTDTIKQRKLKSRDIEKILDIPQPRVSELINGKMFSMSIEKLLSYLEKMGIEASISFKNKKAG